MRGAINSAIAAAYGKDTDGFDRFLASLLDADEQPRQAAPEATAQMLGVKPADVNSGDGMSDWQELE